RQHSTPRSPRRSGKLLTPSVRACSRGGGRFIISRRNLRCTTFTVPSGCVVSAPELGLSPVGLRPDPVFPGEGTFLSGRPLPTRTTVSCPLPPGEWAISRRGKSARVGTAKQDNPLRGLLPVANGSPTSARAASGGADASPSTPLLVPCLMLRRGQVCLPGPKGPVRVRTRSGPALDPFDVVD